MHHDTAATHIGYVGYRDWTQQYIQQRIISLLDEQYHLAYALLGPVHSKN